MHKCATIREAVTAAVNEGIALEERDKEARIDSDYGWWLANRWRWQLVPELYKTTRYVTVREI